MESADPLPQPENLLLMSAGAYYREQRGVVSVWVRDDDEGNWSYSFIKSGSATNGLRWVPRDIEVYTDTVTAVKRIFLLLGNLGIISGVYDASQPTKIRWDDNIEFPKNSTVATRPLAIIQANGSLFFAVGGVIYKRIDGPKPESEEIINLGEDVNTNMGEFSAWQLFPIQMVMVSPWYLHGTPRGLDKSS